MNVGFSFSRLQDLHNSHSAEQRIADSSDPRQVTVLIASAVSGIGFLESPGATSKATLPKRNDREPVEDAKVPFIVRHESPNAGPLIGRCQQGIQEPFSPQLVPSQPF